MRRICVRLAIRRITGIYLQIDDPFNHFVWSDMGWVPGERRTLPGRYDVHSHNFRRRHRRDKHASCKQQHREVCLHSAVRKTEDWEFSSGAKKIAISPKGSQGNDLSLNLGITWVGQPLLQIITNLAQTAQKVVPTAKRMAKWESVLLVFRLL
jgi:hypothetical protein